MAEPKLILLVEDNKHDELLTLRALKQHNIQHDVVICRDGAEALDFVLRRGAHAARDPGAHPAVTLLDLKIPKVDGLEVLAAIRKNPETKQWPVVILTTSREEVDVARSYENGANSYVQKPVDYQSFSEAVKHLGLYWLLVNHPPEARPEA